MNYYEHHIGDYDKNTSHLSACEDGIYCRLIRRYFDKERPLEADVHLLQRKVRARTKEERQAVVDVLAEFFSMQSDGWHNKTCDEVLEKFRAGAPEREAKKINSETRLQRHREERAALFKIVNLAGEHYPYNIAIGDLRAAAARLQAATPATLPETHSATPAATAPATPATATQTPVTNTQSPTDLFLSEGVPAAPPPDLTPAPAPAPKKPPKTSKPKEEPVTNEVWEAYSHAYKRKYGSEPVRNASVNGQLVMLLQRIGREEAPNVARFYLAIEDRRYVMHPVKLLLADAESIRTRWFTARERIEAEPQSERARRAAEALAPLGIKTAATLLPQEDQRVIAH